MGPQKHRLFLLKKLKERRVKSILDVGCGTGCLWDLIDWQVVYKGVDYSHAMIKTCKKTFPEVIWQVQDARHLDEEDNSWEAVVLMHCLDHLDNYQAAIKEAARVARKYVFIILWRPLLEKGTNLNSVNTMHKKPGEKPWNDTHLQEYSAKVLLKEFKKNKLKLVRGYSGNEINDKGSYNTMFILKK